MRMTSSGRSDTYMLTGWELADVRSKISERMPLTGVTVSGEANHMETELNSAVTGVCREIASPEELQEILAPIRGHEFAKAAFDVAFCALLPCEGRRGRRRVHRLVVRPEFQGLGIGGAFLDALGALERSRGFGLEIVVGTPFFVRRCGRRSGGKRRCAPRISEIKNEVLFII